MKILDVPHTNLTEMKKSPSQAFDIARQTNTGVYVFKNSKPYGVAVTTQQYESIFKEIESLQNQLDEYIVKERLSKTNYKTYTEKEVLGDRLAHVTYEDDDGWE